MIVLSYEDVEDLVQTWLKTTSVNSLVNGKIFQAMPEGAPNPSVILSLVSTSTAQQSDMALESPRISFAVWGTNRTQAKAIKKALVSEIESLGMSGGFYSSSPSAYLETASTLTAEWRPDRKIARYIVDAYFIALTPR